MLYLFRMSYGDELDDDWVLYIKGFVEAKTFNDAWRQSDYSMGSAIARMTSNKENWTISVRNDKRYYDIVACESCEGEGTECEACDGSGFRYRYEVDDKRAKKS